MTNSTSENKYIWNSHFQNLNVFREMCRIRKSYRQLQQIKQLLCHPDISPSLTYHHCSTMYTNICRKNIKQVILTWLDPNRSGTQEVSRQRGMHCGLQHGAVLSDHCFQQHWLLHRPLTESAQPQDCHLYMLSNAEAGFRTPAPHRDHDVWPDLQDNLLWWAAEHIDSNITVLASKVNWLQYSTP